MAVRSRIKGGKGFRRIMRQMPDAMRAELREVLRKSEPDAIALVRSRAAGSTKRRSGRLLAGIKAKTTPKSLRMQVGFLGTKRQRLSLFYARILDLGRKGKMHTVKRYRNRTLKNRGKLRRDHLGRLRYIGSPWRLRVRALSPRRFVTGGLGSLRAVIGKQLRGVFDRALRRIGGGDA